MTKVLVCTNRNINFFDDDERIDYIFTDKASVENYKLSEFSSVLWDLDLENLQEIQTIKEIIKLYVIRVVVLGNTSSRRFRAEISEYGAVYINSSNPPEIAMLKDDILVTPYGKCIVGMLVDLVRFNKYKSMISKNEFEIINSIAFGIDNREICKKFGISEIELMKDIDGVKNKLEFKTLESLIKTFKQLNPDIAK